MVGSRGGLKCQLCTVVSSPVPAAWPLYLAAIKQHVDYKPEACIAVLSSLCRRHWTAGG